MLNTQQFGQQLPLPGMESAMHLLAKPHEQTPSQFMNRKDLMVHGRFADPELEGNGYHVKSWDFHAGSEEAAHQRLRDIVEGTGRQWGATEPRYLHGRVDRSAMKNDTPTRDWSNGSHMDMGSAWDESRGNSYYINEFEDPGSVSAILHTGRKATLKSPLDPQFDFEQNRPKNFMTWREGVTHAINQGLPVPSHVRGIYNDTGGEQGPQHVYHPEFNPASRRRESLTSIDQGELMDSTSVAMMHPKNAEWKATPSNPNEHPSKSRGGKKNTPPF